MDELKKVQNRIRNLWLLSLVLTIFIIVFGAVMMRKDSYLVALCPIFAIIDMVILFYIRKTCTCKKCGHILKVQKFLELENWNCPAGKHKMRQNMQKALTFQLFNTIIFAYVKGNDGTSNFSEVSRERNIWWKFLI